MHVKPIKLTDLLFFGGVASNKGLRYRLQQLCEDNNIHLSIPSPKLCTDNAAMIGLCGILLLSVRNSD